YLPLLRGLNPQSLEVFDPVDQTLVSGVREETNVPSQALFLLNSAFVRKNSLAHAEKLIAKGANDEARIESAYRAILGRRPEKEEIAGAKNFLAAFEAEAKTAKSVQLASATIKAASNSAPASGPQPKAAKGGKAGKRKAKADAEAAAKSIADAAGAQGKDSAKDAPAKLAPIVDPDQADTSGDPIVEEGAAVSDPKTAAWLGFVQALYGSAEFRYVR
ncbi:MAG TPA: DUF1553 domain-containing protein, partial [Planctomycetia bacterium]|nr:DUF1553 domain-containing protein [Planctomycetia bacterium]